MINKKLDFVNTEQLDEIDHLRKKMIKFDGKHTAGNLAGPGKKNKSYYSPVVGMHNKVDIKKSDIINQDIIDIVFKGKSSEYINDHITAGYYGILDSRITEYNEGDEYDWHLDFVLSSTGISRGIIQTNKLSFTLFLNDTKEYEGGELCIDINGEIKRFKEKKGTIVIYPSDKLHKVTKITKGIRQVLIGWIYCPFKDPADRYVLCKSQQALNILLEHSKKNPEFKEALRSFWQLRQAFEKKSLSQ